MLIVMCVISAVCAALFISALIWIRLRERHWVGMIEKINQSWNNAYKAPPTGYAHTRLRSDSRPLPPVREHLRPHKATRA